MHYVQVSPMTAGGYWTGFILQKRIVNHNTDNSGKSFSKSEIFTPIN